MASKKVIENRQLLEQYLSHCDYGEGLALLYRNNYYLDDKKQDCYTRMFEISKDAVQLYYSLKINKELQKIYNDIIEETRLFISSNYDKKILSLYAAIICLIHYGAFRGEERINKYNWYKDYYSMMGMDVILGHSCCRHEAALIKDILRGFTDTMVMSVGKSENITPNHVILCAKSNGLNLFLESTMSDLLYPYSNFEVLNIENNSYFIKAAYSYISEMDFTNLDEFYNFYKNLYKSSKIPLYKWTAMAYELANKTFIYRTNEGLMEKMSLTLKPYRDKIKNKLI